MTKRSVNLLLTWTLKVRFVFVNDGLDWKMLFSVAHRTRQFEAWLTDCLENFTMHQEGQVFKDTQASEDYDYARIRATNTMETFNPL